MVAVEIFRLIEGKVVEHSASGQEKVPAELIESVSPMFTRSGSNPVS
jgi:hypothetical protein